MKQSIEDKAAFFLSCKREGFSKEEEKEFKAWLEESSEHKKTFERLENLEKLYFSLSKNLKTKISEEIYQDIENRKILKKRRILQIAASFIFFLSFSFFTINEYINFGIKHNFSTNTKIKEIVLPDGSKVFLDAKTTLDIKYYKDKREVNIARGKAFFDVARDETKPFVVNANMIKVEVLGTNFEVKNERDKIVVDVASGKVKVSKNQNGEFKSLAFLTKAKHLDFDKKNEKLLIKNIDIKNISSWKDGILFFQDTSLQKAINEFKKYHNIEVEIQKELKGYSISGSFYVQDLDKFLFALTKIYSLKFYKKANFIHIYKKY